MYRAWTGVGSRETPQEFQLHMISIANRLTRNGWTLRSGKADGADALFQNGVQASGREGSAEIYKPWHSFNSSPNSDSFTLESGLVVMNYWDIAGDRLPNWAEAEEIASQIHPAWDRLKRGAKALHTRNVYQVLGKDLNSPSEFLLCYAPVQGKSVKGGTRTAYELAKEYDVPCFNYASMSKEAIVSAIKEFVDAA